MMRCTDPAAGNARAATPAARRGRGAALRLLALCALAAAPGLSGAAERCFVVDAARSHVEFRIRYLGLFSPGGRFDRVQGVVRFDPDHWDTLGVSIRIEVDSLESRPRFWRDELLGPRFFDHARYPTIAFDGARGERDGPAAGRAFGLLTLRGISRPIVLRARLAPAVDALDIDADASVRRTDYGLGGVLPLANEEVSIALHLRAAAGRCGT